MFNSEFCEVNYLERENIVFLTWKKFCSLEDYREPVGYALDLIKNHKDSNFICDARNGFEDIEEDVKWDFEVFIPELSKAGCKQVVFIVDAVNPIEGEIDMFTKEFKKYFLVDKVNSLEEALKIIKHNVILNVTYAVKPGMRQNFYNEILEKGIDKASRNEEGNIKYDYYFPVEESDKILLIEIWKDKEAQKLHNQSEHFKALKEIKDKYVIETHIVTM